MEANSSGNRSEMDLTVFGNSMSCFFGFELMNCVLLCCISLLAFGTFAKYFSITLQFVTNWHDGHTIEPSYESGM